MEHTFILFAEFLGAIAALIAIFDLGRRLVRRIIEEPHVVIISKASSGYSEAFLDSFRLEIASRLPKVKLATENAPNDDVSSWFVAKFEAVVKRRPDAIVAIIPHEKEKLHAIARKAILEGVPIVCIDQGLDSDYFHELGLIPPAVISCDNERGGVLAAEELASQLKPGANVAIITGPGNSITSNARKNAFTQTALQHHLVIGWQLETNWDLRGRDGDLQRVSSGRPPVEAVFCCNDIMAIQAIEIGRRIWKNAKPKFVGFDGIREALMMVKRGEMWATIDQEIQTQASHAVGQIEDIVRGKKLYLKRHKVDIRITPRLRGGEERI